MTDKLVTLSNFAAFANKCKKIFAHTHASTTSGNWCIITLDAPWSDSFILSGTITGQCDSNVLDSKLECSYSNASNSATGALLNNGLLIESGAIVNADSKIQILLNVSDLKYINAYISVTDNDKTYNKVSSITYSASVDPSSYATRINITSSDIESGFPYIMSKAVAASDVEFSVIDSDGTLIDYSQGASFNSIESAGKLANPVNINLTGSVTGSVFTDLSEDLEIETTIDENDSNLLNAIANYHNTHSILPATTDDYGTVKLGSNTESGRLNLQMDGVHGAYVTLKDSSVLPYLRQLESLPTIDSSIDDGDIVEYVGESTDSYTNGYTYQASTTTVTRNVKNYQWVGTDESISYNASDAAYTSDSNPFDYFFDNTEDEPKALVKDEEDVWRFNEGDDGLTTDQLIEMLGTARESILRSVTGITVSYTGESGTTTEQHLTWALKNVQPGGGSTYTAGSNIDLTSNVITAKGYAIDSGLDLATTNMDLKFGSPVGYPTDVLETINADTTITPKASVLRMFCTIEGDGTKTYNITFLPDALSYKTEYGTREVQCVFIVKDAQQAATITLSDDKSSFLFNMTGMDSVTLSQSTGIYCAEFCITFWSGTDDIPRLVTYNGGVNKV